MTVTDRSAVDGIDDATHTLLAEISRWLRYNPEWTGEISLIAGIQKGVFVSTDLGIRSVRTRRTKQIPDDVDRRRTNEKAFSAIRRRLRLQAERALSYNSQLYGTLCATCHFRQGVLIRADAYVSDTELSELIRF